MNRIVLLLFSFWLSDLSVACSCMPRSDPVTPRTTASLEASLTAWTRQDVLSAEEVLRVRVLSSSDYSRRTPVRVLVLESLKTADSSRQERLVEPGPSFCDVSLYRDEEWLLFLQEGRVMFCAWNELLSGASRTRTPTDQELETMKLQYKRAARHLEISRKLSGSRKTP